MHRGSGFGGGGEPLRRVYDFNRVKFVCWGDSLTTSYASSLFSASYTPTRRVFDGGVTSDSITQIATRMLADSHYIGRVAIFWDRMNVGDTTANYLAQMALMVAHQASGRYVVISDINKTDGTENVGSGWRTDMIARNAALAAAYGSHFLDVVTALDSDALRIDGLHLTAAANTTIVIPAIAQKLVDLGYMNVTS